ncbi:substrate-binding periplasmic protein [Vibrio caribbeanicus]|uniref:ABC-type amino acid transport/signal transduction system, periplasmic component n=1 Tax=Vibrio caribbeanicus ATCC BAA-2122 TaxID=796620 RepID=E3BJX7_9VIBR|nr:transporter substrate-binding domain-containing protein [Vibrio caribbeanicus]EFP96605.1 ABC-type amino acid transport/signal transduction system, periplasmic component [Vibrio caribbeanicus ATCC BAA-2122]
MIKVMFHIICLSVLLNISFFAHAKVVKIANGEWPPYTSSKLRHGGFLTHIVKEAFETQGYTVQFSYLSWNRGFEMTRLGFFDSTIGWTRTEEREKHFFFSEPIFNKSTSVFQLKNKPISWLHNTDLGQYRVGGVVGYTYGIDELEKQGEVKVLRSPSLEKSYRMLMLNRLDAVLSNTLAGLEIIKQLGLTHKIEANPKLFAERDYHIIFSKKSPQNDALVEAFNRGLAELKMQGKLEEYIRASARGDYKM